MKRLLALLSIVLIAACNDEVEEDTRPVYTIQPLEIVDQQLFVVAADQSADSVAMTSTQDSSAYKARIFRLPTYLETHTIRSFKQLDPVNWQVTIQVPDGSFPYTDSIVLDGGQFVQLPDYWYDSTDDIVYQCDRSIKTIKGPLDPGFSTTAKLTCNSESNAVMANNAAATASPTDTLLISQLHLPYKQL